MTSERLVQFQCIKEGTIFYYQTRVRHTSHIVSHCPVCGSTCVDPTRRTYAPVNEYKPLASTKVMV